ncbi:MAG: hypothetical protein PHU53_07545 [Thermoplasmata archaeon]|nr:hypothetical protein [Thermoplasmata archaeon]
MMIDKTMVAFICVTLIAAPFLATASGPSEDVTGVFETGVSRVAPASDGTRASQPGNLPSGICYVWEQAEPFNPSVSVCTMGTNNKGIVIDQTGTWTYNAAYDQCSGDVGSIWDVWATGENAVMIYEVFNDQSTTWRNYTMIYEDQMEGDGATNFGGGAYPVEPNILTPINDPIIAWNYEPNNTCCVKIDAQTTGFEVPSLFDGYGVWKSTMPITQSNQGTFIGDATLTAGGYWQYIDAAWSASSYYAVRIKWDGGTYPFYAPRYSYGMSNDVWGDSFCWQSVAIGPVGSSSSPGPFNITFNTGCACNLNTDLYYSNDNNATWHYIASVYNEFYLPTLTYSWNAPGSGIYWWQAIGGCGEYDPPTAWQPAEAGPYVITLPPSPHFDIPVISGWNLISFPQVASGSPTIVLDDCGGDTTWSVIKWYNPQTPNDPWKTYRIGGTANDLPGVSNRMGLWVYITDVGSDGQLVLDGDDPGTIQIELYSGWNLVGYPTMTNDTVANVFWGTGVDRVEIFDPVYPYIKAAEPTYVMHAGEGYWVHVAYDTVWTVDW